MSYDASAGMTHAARLTLKRRGVAAQSSTRHTRAEGLDFMQQQLCDCSSCAKHCNWDYGLHSCSLGSSQDSRLFCNLLLEHMHGCREPLGCAWASVCGYMLTLPKVGGGGEGG